MSASTPIKVVILGSTGSIGRQAVDVVSASRGRLQVVGLAAGTKAEALERQAAQLGCDRTGLGPEAAVELARLEEADVVLNAIVGAAGLRASIAALEAGKTLALANKESLVAGGALCLRAAERGGGRIVPVDSEHAALAQCLAGRAPSSVSRIVLTASGGPFRTRPDLDGVTPEEALAHPTWNMGPKITVDCATLMNKGLEVIEAHHLFGIDYDRIGVLVQPQSLIHAVVEFADGSSLLQAAPPDMRIPIQAALTGELSTGAAAPVDLAAAGTVTFEEVDHDRFPALALAYEAGKLGGSYPAALNAANEVAVAAFLEGFIAFTDIARVVQEVVAEHRPVELADLDAVARVDAAARNHARRVAAGCKTVALAGKSAGGVGLEDE